jgi:precorrin-6A/cobalt-precorrin-6A reductase
MASHRCRGLVAPISGLVSRTIETLISGVTSEASALARVLANDHRFQATMSLAGRTQRPAQHPLPARSGGFGGVEGLANYLVEHRIRALVDATHAFAVQITRHAELTTQLTSTPLLVVQRPPWQRKRGDHWLDVPDLQSAVQAVGTVPKRVLLTIGQTDLAAFRSSPENVYVVRSIETPRPEDLPISAQVITARGPFSLEHEIALLRERRIDVLVTKNSGGTATEAKLVAARLLNITVVMISRPTLPRARTVATVAEALMWLGQCHAEYRRGE